MLYTCVLHFYFGESVTFFLTLQENVTLSNPSYLFVFTKRVPDSGVAIVLTPDDSNARADKFTVDVSAVFDGYGTGQYTYQVFEQESDSNTDVAATGRELERGIVELYPDTDFSYTQAVGTSHFIQPQ